MRSESEEDDYIIPAVRNGSSSGLPQTETPTITLLRKAREDPNFGSSTPLRLDPDYSWSKSTTQRVVTNKGPAPKVAGVGPTENGVPITPRGNVQDEFGSDWYRTMYKRLHQYKKPNDDQEVITVRVKRGLSHYRDDGYVSEPEHSSAERRRFGDKRWPFEHNQEDSKNYSAYRVEPRRIEDYQPGDSSVVHVDSSVQRDKMYNQSRYNPPVPALPKSNYVFNEDDSYKMVKICQPEASSSSEQQRQCYRSIQKGADIPITGLRRPGPEPHKEPLVGPCPTVQSSDCYDIDFSDAYKFLDSQHLSLERDYEDLQAMRRRKIQQLEKFKEESEVKKKIQEQVEQEMRRHHDNLSPREKSPVPLNRYDGAYEYVYFSPDNKEVILLGRVIYDFIAHAPKELMLKKGDLVYIHKKIDRNWYEGECLGRSGIFPVRYVDAFPPSSIDTLAATHIQEGSAVGRYNFPAKNQNELSFKQGDPLQLLRRIDHNWFEAKIGTRRGIVPANYITITAEPLEIRKR